VGQRSLASRWAKLNYDRTFKLMVDGRRGPLAGAIREGAQAGDAPRITGYSPAYIQGVLAVIDVAVRVAPADP